MSTALDMSLDDIIKNNKKSSGGGGGGGGGGSCGRDRSGPGPNRRTQTRSNGRPGAPYSMGKAADYGVYSDQVAAFTAPMARIASIETGTKLYISNLDYGVSNEDIKELFSEVGDLKRYSVHYDRSGRSKGTAEVVFARKEHALAAVKRYNNVQLDGKPMKIEVVGTNIEKPAASPLVANMSFRNPIVIPRSDGGRCGSMGKPRGGGRGGQRGGRGRGRGRGDPPSAADLDAELDKYHAEAMQIN